MDPTDARADTFARFIDGLAAALAADDPAARALGRDELQPDGSRLGGQAARAWLSRSQYDRVIRSIAGEPPATFRRRVLLERSAYQLATTHAGILEIALAAGYSSHEAFVRAFRRAYGVNPSAWRSAPRQIRLPAPSDVHFHPPAGVRLPTRTEVSSMDLLVRMVEHHVWLTGELVQRAARLDDAALDKRIELSVEDIDEQQTIRSLLSRLVGQMDMWNNVIHDRPYAWDVEQHETVDSMRSRLASAGAEFLAEVRRVVTEGRLDETFIDAHCSPPEVFTYGGLIAHVLTFAAHRRTMVLGALASAGITDLGAGDPRTWVEAPA